MDAKELVVRPIGFVRSPYGEKVEAPRQGVSGGAAGTVELLPEYKDGLEDLEGFERIWLLFWFDRATGWRPKVQPPRSDKRRGVFATRAPHRPNPIGMTAVRLTRIDGLVLHIAGVDLVDGTPILDVKPYIAYADAFPEASAGWLDADPRVDWSVAFAPAAEEAVAWVAAETGFDLRERVSAALALGPQPHAYRRIKETPEGLVLAVKEWRALFQIVEGERRIVVSRIDSGYRARDLAEGTEAVHALHRAFLTRHDSDR